VTEGSSAAQKRVFNSIVVSYLFAVELLYKCSISRVAMQYSCTVLYQHAVITYA